MTIRIFYKRKPFASIRNATIKQFQELWAGFEDEKDFTLRVSDD